MWYTSRTSSFQIYHDRASWSSCMIWHVKDYVQEELLDNILKIDRRDDLDKKTHLGQPFLSTVRQTRDKTTAQVSHM